MVSLPRCAGVAAIVVAAAAWGTVGELALARAAALEAQEAESAAPPESRPAAEVEPAPPAASPPKMKPRRQLDPVRRTYLLMALLGVTLIGVMAILLVMSLARHVRRTARRPLPPTPLPREEDWYRKPLVPTDDPPDEPDEAR